MKKKVGFVGLGQMGKWMALNVLKAGFDLTVFDIQEEAMQALALQGARRAASPAALARDTDWIVLSLPDAGVVEQVVYGENGLARGSGKGWILVDCGTTDYQKTLWVSKSLQGDGIRFVDAPVTGTDLRARDATLTIMCGGNEEDVNEIRPLLSAIGNKTVHMGAVGNGQLAKLVNQLLYNANMATLAEVLPMAAKLGLEPEKISEVINTGSGRSFASEFFLPGILDNRFNRGYNLQNAYKDMVAAASISAENRIPLPMVHTAATTYQMALAAGLGNEDKGAMVKVFEKALGVAFRKKGG